MTDSHVRYVWQMDSEEMAWARVAQGFPGGSDGKESAFNAGDAGSIPGWGRSSGEGNGYPLQYSCLEYLHGLNDLAGYNPWGHKESDTTE